jgi:hypothetical protein
VSGKRVQVRLDDDVAEALQRAADRAEHSLTVEANLRLRRQLGLQPGGPSQGAAGWQGASRVRAPRGIIGAGKGPSPTEQRRRARR